MVQPQREARLTRASPHSTVAAAERRWPQDRHNSDSSQVKRPTPHRRAMTYTVISNWSHGAWPIVRLLEDRARDANAPWGRHALDRGGVPAPRPKLLSRRGSSTPPSITLLVSTGAGTRRADGRTAPAKDGP